MKIIYEGLAIIHSLEGKEDMVKIVEKRGDNEYIAEYGNIKCTAIFNPFVGRFYVDDKYGIIK